MDVIIMAEEYKMPVNNAAKNYPDVIWAFVWLNQMSVYGYGGLTLEPTTMNSIPMMQLIHMTATYSNAMLVAILPQCFRLRQTIRPAIAQPITTSQVRSFMAASPYKNYIAGGICCTNHIGSF